VKLSTPTTEKPECVRSEHHEGYMPLPYKILITIILLGYGVGIWGLLGPVFPQTPFDKFRQRCSKYGLLMVLGGILSTLLIFLWGL
jgi:hypothetical protein